jgi:acetyl esterase/lipase
VLIYLHGGAFMNPAIPHMFSFCPRIHQDLLQRDGAKDFGVVALLYSLYPAQFPTQLNELTLALVHLFASGLKQENAILIGDSAGGNLIMQLLVHTLHPFEGVPLSPLRRFQRPSADAVEVTRLGGVCLLSPWLSVDTPTPSYTRNNEFDVLPGSAFLDLGRKYMKGVPDSYIPWIKPTFLTLDSEVPWFAGLDEYVARVLITAGGREVLLDDSTGLYSALTKLPARNIDVQLDVEEDGIHEDPIFDIGYPQKPGGGLSDATMKIVNWVGESFGF